ARPWFVVPLVDWPIQHKKWPIEVVQMAKPKTDAAYARQLATMAEEGLKPPRIFRELEQQAKAEGRDDHPSERTVRRLYEEWKQQPEAVRRQHARFHWP